ncbi:MAG: hypothetical protein AB7E37_04640 [Candidatus Altimarinota bacterium]
MKKIRNRFIDIILLVISFFVSIIRSIKALITGKKTIKRSSSFDSIDYVFRIWPHSFWKKPSFFKIGIFVAAFIKYIFYKKK